MYEQELQGDVFYLMFYAGVAVFSLVGCCYLLLRRANAIAPDVTPPVRLRRWTAAFFASMTLSHIWYLPVAFSTSREDVLLSNIVGAVLDFMTLIPLALAVLIVMLQDRRRALWPVFLMMTPMVIGLVACGVSRSVALLPILCVYYLLLAIGIIIYMVRATRQYGRWLRDNYADLEHKEVWQSFVIVAIILFVFFFYAFEAQVPVAKYVTQLNNMILVSLLLWRVETLSDLNLDQRIPSQEQTAFSSDSTEEQGISQTIQDKIGPLLQQYCIDTQFYLQHDMTLNQLARAIGTNRFYLSQYFSNQGTTYNAYINNLRINHFKSLYQKATAIHRIFTVQQLASESGYRSYSTFSRAFKQEIGKSVRKWMDETDKNCSNQQK